MGGRRWELLAVAGVCIGVAVFRFFLLRAAGEAPPGADPGGWLSLSYELLGEHVRAVPTAYPPVVPLLVRGLSLVLTPLPALTAVGAAASVLGALPFYLLVRSHTGPLIAMAFGAASLFLGLSMEMLGWGAYPQLLSDALFLFALYGLGRGVLDDRKGPIIWASAAGALCLATSMLGGVALALVSPVFLLGLWLLAGAPFRTVTFRAGQWAAWGALFSLPALPAVAEYVKGAGGAGVLNLRGQGAEILPEAFRWMLGGLPKPVNDLSGSLVLLALISVCALAQWRRRSPLPSAVLATTLVMLALYLKTFELRVLHLFVVGLLAGLPLVLDLALRLARHLPGPKAVRWVARGLVALLAVAIAGSVVQGGHERTQSSIRYHRLVDGEVLEALRVLRDLPDRGGLVVASGSPQGFQHAWWVEGYARRPAYSATDPYWEAGQGRKNNEAANALLGARSTVGINALVQANDVRYLFLDKRVVRDRDKYLEAGFRRVFENRTILLLGRS